ncbi:larval cuticle protein F1-like [Vanessa atalanta]|uniref:larval cuticle protein F1-like n=1 Tax=Vanessa atalanta TaxID=42275 RepID=UPI001FCE077D|nr:larval cuticle protein F1-like [Vanessa atalanta]
MRVLIVAAAVLACAAAAPSGALLAHGSPYAHGLLGHGAPLAVAHGAAYGLAHAAPLAVAHAPAVPTIPPGDIHGAAIDAHVDATDHARAAVDAAREYHDQASELQGQAINAAEDHAWQAVDAAQTAQAQVDGAAAGVAPNVARQLAGHGHVAAYAAAPALVGHAGYGHAAYAGHGLAAPLLAGHGVAAPLLAGHGIAAVGGSHSVATSSLSQTHPAPVVHAPVAYAAHGAYGAGLAHGAYGHGLAHGW